MLDDKVLGLIGTKLRARRSAKHMSLRTLADMCGVPKSTIARYEQGRDGSIDNLAKICAYLGLDYATLVQDSMDEVYAEHKVMTLAEFLDQEGLEHYKELISSYDELDDAQKESVLNLIRTMIK